MNTIIIPTDLSSTADPAIVYGIGLAEHIQGNILLLNSYMVPITLNEVPILLISAEELKASVEEGIKHYRQELQTMHPHLQIHTESRMGEMIDELDAVCRKTIPFAVVMDTRKGGGLEELLFGNSTLSLIRQLHYPVINVPGNVVFQKPGTIVLATDLLNIDKLPTGKIVDFVQGLQADLHIVHVINKDTETGEETRLADELNKKLSSLQPHYHAIKDSDIVQGLQQYIELNKADLLMLIPHEHSYLERLFYKLHIKNILTHVSVPVVTIAE